MALFWYWLKMFLENAREFPETITSTGVLLNSLLSRLSRGALSMLVWSFLAEKDGTTSWNARLGTNLSHLVANVDAWSALS